MSTPDSIPRVIVVNANQPSAAERKFADDFSLRVIGQPEAVKIAALAYSAYKNPLRDRRRPIGIYYLVGPSRTGKSLTAEVLAELFHGDPTALIRIQASDYEEKHQILDIKGAPPSYLGYRDRNDPRNRLDDDEDDTASIVSGHNLRRARRGSKEPINIVVIEEFEKSSYDFYKLWMGVFDKGVLKLANGETVDFTNTIFILTSNLATDELEKMAAPSIGFGRDKAPELTESDIRSTVERAMKARYRREFRNRLDATVIFRLLSLKDVSNIVDAEIRLVNERILSQLSHTRHFRVELHQSAKDFLLARCGKEVAQLKREINMSLLVPLGRLLNAPDSAISGGDLVRIFWENGDAELTFGIVAGGGVAELKARRDAPPPRQPSPSSGSDGNSSTRTSSARGGFWVDRDDFID